MESNDDQPGTSSTNTISNSQFYDSPVNQTYIENATYISNTTDKEIVSSIHKLKSAQPKYEKQSYIIDLSESSRKDVQQLYPTMMEVSYFQDDAVKEKEEYTPSNQHTRFRNSKTKNAKELNVDDIIRVLMQCKFLCIIGLPGVGKTHFCHKIKTLFSDKFQSICILLKFMNLNFDLQEPKLTLRQLLIDRNYPELQEDECKSAFKWILDNEENLLLILDGYDQANWSIQENAPQLNYSEPQPVWELISNLCSKKYLPNCHILFTSRPHSIKTLSKSFRKHFTIQLLDLSFDNMKKLFYIFAGSRATEFWDLLHVKAPQLVSLCGNPLLLQLVIKACLSPNSDISNITTLSRLYSFVLDNLNASDHAVHSFAKNVLHCLTILAYNATSSNTVVINEKDLINVGLDLKTVHHLLISHHTNDECHLFEGKTTLFFIHQTLQEYLTALYIYNNMNKLKFWWFIKTKLFTPHWSVVRRFLFGIAFDLYKNADSQQWKRNQMKNILLQKLKSTHVNLIMELVKAAFDIDNNQGDTLLQLCIDVRECADEEITEEAARRFPTNAVFDRIRVSNSDAHAVSLVLRKVKTEIQYFSLCWCFLNSQTFSYFFRAIKDMEGSIDWLDIGRNNLTSDDVDEICDILSKINDRLGMRFCFENGTERNRSASEEEKAKILAKQRSLGHSNLRVFFDSVYFVPGFLQKTAKVKDS